MFNILVVDDEPLICKGLSNLLASSGLDISNIYTANSGFEALDCIRMEEIDLLVTDIQMGAMSGIDLMQHAKLAKPWVQTIVISAHETFQYAQMAVRLGAKDYLIKPLNSEQFLDSVRNVLLKMGKPSPELDVFMSGINESFRLEEPLPEYSKFLNELLIDPGVVLAEADNLQKLDNLKLQGPYFSVLKLKVPLTGVNQNKQYTLRDRRLLCYAALNIAKELMDQEWNSIAFYAPDGEITIIIQWDEKSYEDSSAGQINRLDILGRSLHFNIHKYLHLNVVIGISQILKGLSFMAVLNRQASNAILWNNEHSDHYVFYYGDFNWNSYTSDPSVEELHTHSNLIVQKAKEYIDENYAQKGLTIHDVAKKNHVSPNYLSYLFKKNTGYNLWEYVIKLRMEESREMILNTDLRRYEIAERVGYESPEHFSKIFKKYYGISPSELKK
ncbi:DNA-binding response regulator [Paenibacillus sp. VTT E-133280]|jgi:YesN/AraC family two-component response regulator|uniref:response regulator n=1 Tax=Paenibacillus TaxID=44249 RepID=UPI000BA10214|nr:MULTISPECIES: response regulator [unclassified Paenibacillus]MDH6369833.1 two-component system response regulator YesN [Paenibacillus sp. PastF-3]OZQ61543.1 DNA-binding response regulator [Paenibacillus sp. VTT E-133280]OZQ84801.1 DNA-binding response regulator [Paenibacillus sp. VTT E-133291]